MTVRPEISCSIPYSSFSSNIVPLFFDRENSALRRQLREARDFGLDTLDTIIRERTDYDYDFRKDYLGWHIHFHLGADEKQGVARFMELMQKHGIGPLHKPKYVS